MKRLLSALISVVLIASCFARSIDDVPNVHVADRTKYVSNPDGVLSPAAEAELNSMLGDIWSSTSAEVVVVAVDDLDGMDVNDYATSLFEKWRIGKADKDNGLLILISKGDRRAALRTGYGLEGPLPDITLGRIIREGMIPHFKEEDYDGGTMAAVAQIAERLGREDITKEIKSKYANDSMRRSSQDEEDSDELWAVLLLMAAIGLTASLIIFLYILTSTRSEEPTLRYKKLSEMKLPLLILTFVGLGTPFLFYWLLKRKMKKVRDSKRACPNCGEQMIKLDEVSDNAYLTPAQDTEEQLQSVDYDVWVCPRCNETDIIPFDNPDSPYTVCPRCGSKACTIIGDRTVIHPTARSKGRGVRIYSCKNCGNRHEKYYDIPPKAEGAPVIILPGGFGGGSGGGFSGGSFGGGMTGGGGASGGW